MTNQTAIRYITGFSFAVITTITISNVIYKKKQVEEKQKKYLSDIKKYMKCINDYRAQTQDKQALAKLDELTNSKTLAS